MGERATPTICMVLSEHLTNHYTGPLARGAVHAAAAAGCRLVLLSPLAIYLVRRDLTLDDLPLLPGNVDAYLLPGFVADEVVAWCARRGAALLTYAGARPGLPTIGPDNRAGAYAATAHLIALGRRRIVHIVGQEESVEAQERLAGYRDALAEAGLPFDPELLVSGRFRAFEAEDGTERLIRAGVQFDAIFAANDLNARGALLALNRAGLRVPHDVALVGFDDATGSDELTPPLTTIRQSAFQIGWEAVLALVRQRHALPPVIRTPVELVVRESCGGRAGAESSPDRVATIAAQLGAGQGPVVSRVDAGAWLEEVVATLAHDDWDARLTELVATMQTRGWNLLALRDQLGRLAGHAAELPASRVAAAHGRMIELLDRAQLRERRDRAFRLNAISYVIDLLRAYTHEQASDLVLRYMVGAGPRGAVGASRIGGTDTVAAQWVPEDGSVRQWHGHLDAFPPDEWVQPGDVLMLMAMESGPQRTLMGVVEREARDHIDLADLLLRTINTYRSITRLHETLRELEVARRVQESLLPRQSPEVAGYDIAGASRTARQVGGDLYGYYPRPGGGLALAVGDVAGKGMPAALLMSACVTALAGIIQAGLPPGRTLSQMHQVLQPSIGRNQNAAILLAYLEAEGQQGHSARALFASAGAVAPIVRDAHGARVLDISGLPLGTPLTGLRPYVEVDVLLKPGDMIVLSSDGLVEAMNGRGELYGFDRFLEAVASGPYDNAGAMLAHLMAEVATYTGEAEMHDDMAIVVARYTGGPP